MPLVVSGMCLDVVMGRRVDAGMSGLRHSWTGQTGRVNLGVLTRWVSPELVLASVSGRAGWSGRSSPLTPSFMVYFTLGLALWSQDSYEDVLENLVAGVPELAGDTVDKSSLTAARRKLGEAAMAEVFRRAAALPLARADTAGAYWAGRLVLAVDSFVVDAPESARNRAVLGGPSSGGARNMAYPQARVLTVTETGTHGLRAAAIGGYATAERDLAEQVLHVFTPHHVVLFDAGFPSVRLFHLLAATGAAVVMRTDTRTARNQVTPLPDGTYTAVIKASGKADSPHPEDQVTVRVIEYRLDGGPVIRLLTSLTDPATAPAEQIATLYAERWQAEHTFREIKTIQAGRSHILRSGTPDMVRQEIWAHLVLHVCLRRLAVDIADHDHLDPDRISFVKILKHARRTVIAQITGITTALIADLRRWTNPQRTPRTADRTLKRTRNRYSLRPAGSRSKPITTPAPPRTLTLNPLLA